MKVRADEFNNIVIPKEHRVSNSQLNCVAKLLVCILSEYAIGYLKYDESDQTLYPYIRRYFFGEIRAKDLLKKMMENQEITERFSFIQDIIQTFDNEKWSNTLSKIIINVEDSGNSYFVDGEEYKTPRLFLNIVKKQELCYAQGYVIDDVKNNIYFANFDNEDEIYEIESPYKFAVANEEMTIRVNDVCRISEEEFFLMEEIRDSDQEQKNAIKESITHNLVVLAGAGSGKTRTLVSRLAYLHLVEGVPLSKIVLLTFTRAAAEEMQRRAEYLIKQAYEKMNAKKKPYVFAKTFDGFFRRLILDYYAEIGFTKQPVLLLDNDNDEIKYKKRKMIKEVIEENQLQGLFESYLGENAKLDRLIKSMEDYAVGVTVNQPGIDRLLSIFLEKQIEENIVLGFLYVNLLIKDAIQQEQSALFTILQMRYSCVLIDEFQDVSMLQNETLKRFYSTSIHFTFVGDDDQSIYAWRGADVSIIQSIVNENNTKTCYLMTNYRNNPNIVKAGNCILRLLENRTKNGEIVPHKIQGSKIRIAINDKNYANVVDEIERLIHAGCKSEEISVLTRKREQAKLITKALQAIGIAVERQDTDLVLDSYYKLLKNLINIWCEYDLESSCRSLAKMAKKEDCITREIYHIIRGDAYCEDSKLAVFQRISSYMVENSTSTLAEVVDRYAEKIAEEFDRSIIGKTSHEAIEVFSEYCNDVEAPWPITKKQLLGIYSTFENQSKRYNRTKKAGNGVSVSTIHGAKGLEYDVVMITGLNAGEYPNIATIDNQYSQKIRELESLKNARQEYYELKKDMTEMRYNMLLDACNNSEYTSEESKIMRLFNDFLIRNKRSIIGLNADIVDEYLSLYHDRISPIERKYKYELARLSKDIAMLEEAIKKKEEQIRVIEQDETDRENSITENDVQKELQELNNDLEAIKIKHQEKEKQEKYFICASKNLKGYRNLSFLVTGLLADMEKAEEIEKIKIELEKEKKERVAEERRIFYVAVTRARDHLYLFSDQGASQSEFISDIDDELKTVYKAMTKTERKDYEIIKQSLRKEIEKTDVNEEIISEKIKGLTNNETFRNYIEQRKNTFLKENTEFMKLPYDSKEYLEQAISLLFIGEMTGTEFLPEFAHNMERAMEVLLEDEAGNNAIPFATNDLNVLKSIVEQVRKDASICRTQIPSRKFIENIILKDNSDIQIDSLKKIGIMHYIVRSHNFRINKNVYSTWKKQKFYGNSQQFLKSIIDLSNTRNVYIHRRENQWPQDAITDILNDAKCIINCTLG